MQHGGWLKAFRGDGEGERKEMGTREPKENAAYFVRNSRVSRGEKVATVAGEY